MFCYLFLIPILKGIMVYFNCCLISINNVPLVVSCYSSLMVSRTVMMGTQSVHEKVERLYTLALLSVPRIFY